jgi:hypothetical protein
MTREVVVMFGAGGGFLAAMEAARGLLETDLVVMMVAVEAEGLVVEARETGG